MRQHQQIMVNLFRCGIKYRDWSIFLWRAACPAFSLWSITVLACNCQGPAWGGLCASPGTVLPTSRTCSVPRWRLQGPRARHPWSRRFPQKGSASGRGWHCAHSGHSLACSQHRASKGHCVSYTVIVRGEVRSMNSFLHLQPPSSTFWSNTFWLERHKSQWNKSWKLSSISTLILVTLAFSVYHTKSCLTWIN